MNIMGNETPTTIKTFIGVVRGVYPFKTKLNTTRDPPSQTQRVLPIGSPEKKDKTDEVTKVEYSITSTLDHLGTSEQRIRSSDVTMTSL